MAALARSVDVDELLAHRTDPDARMVLEDLQRERGERPTRLGAAIWIANAYTYANTYAYAYTYAYTYAYADADAYADAYADANAYTYADANAYTYADANAYTYADVRKLARYLSEEPNMREGLVLIKTPGYYGGPTRIGWLRRVNGDLYELMPGFRSVSRTSGERALEEVAADGPGRDHKLGVASRVAEDINAFLVWRCVRADEKAWAAECPKPKEWGK